MGQYYRPILKEGRGRKSFTFSPYDFDNGAKLMEHSYIGNKYVRCIEMQLLNHPMKLTWAGDYADPIIKRDGSVKKDKDGREINLYMQTKEVNVTKDFVNSVSENCNNIKSEDGYTFIVNHTKRQFCKNEGTKGKYGLKISPLPLLTADGNGRGGGDYEGSDMEFVGAWKGDLIEIKTKEPDGYKEISPKFVEG